MSPATQPNHTGGVGLVGTVALGVDTALSATAIAVVILSLVTMFLALMAEVVVRYLTSQGMGWPSEVPNILFPWLVMGGVVLAAQRGQHIAVTALLGVLGRTGNRILLLSLQVLTAVTFFYLAFVGLDVLEITGTEVFPVTGLTVFWAYLALIGGFLGLGITALTTFVHLLLASDPLSVRIHHIEEAV